MSHRGAQWAMAVLVLSLALSACASSGTPAAGATADPHVDEFFAHVRSDTDHQWLEEESDAWLATLPKQSRIRIAERALRDSDAEVRYVGVAQFYRLGEDARGDDAAAQLAIQGGDLTGLGWGWLHSGKPGLLEERRAGIRKALLARYDQLTPEQQANARKVLCGDDAPCDPHAAAGR
jgi:hypothetical protein